MNAQDIMSRFNRSRYHHEVVSLVADVEKDLDWKVAPEEVTSDVLKYTLVHRHSPARIKVTWENSGDHREIGRYDDPGNGAAVSGTQL